MVNFGYTFESEITKSLKNSKELGYKFWYQKMVDTKMLDYSLRCQHCHKKTTHGLILPKTIADFIIINDMGVHFLEVKSSKHKTSYPILNISDHQRKWGRQIHSYEYATYHFLIHNRYKQGDFRAWVLDAFELDDLISEVYPRKSIKWELFDNYQEIERGIGQSWSIYPYLDIIERQKESDIDEIDN